MADGTTMTMDSLLGKACALCSAAGVSFVDFDDKPNPFRATSFRADHVLSSRAGLAPESQISRDGQVGLRW